MISPKLFAAYAQIIVSHNHGLVAQHRGSTDIVKGTVDGSWVILHEEAGDSGVVDVRVRCGFPGCDTRGEQQEGAEGRKSEHGDND